MCGSMAQQSGKWAVAFPITDNITNSNDSISIVQVALPDAHPVIAEKTLGLLKGLNVNNEKDTAAIGYGRCHLIKSDYYYFGIKLYKGRRQPQQGDLLYMMLPKPADIFEGRIPKLANHYIELHKVTDEQLFSAYRVRNGWTAENEKAMLAVMLDDIKATGKAMKEQMPGSNQIIEKGIYNGQQLFDAMQAVQEKELLLFLDYVNARPRLYAGNKWKISEIFATWMVSETPCVAQKG